MTTTPKNCGIHRLPPVCGLEGLTDGELVTQFLDRRDDAALATLIRRHSPMVWGVCCRLLRSHHDAEDAFQATFLVFVQKAATLPNRETVGNWLYGVAYQTAVRMRVIAAKRSVREKQIAAVPEPAAVEEYVSNGLASIVDEELSRLPDKYRILLVLCDLQEVTRKEVARRLDLPEGTVASRLAAARAMLAKRLARRGGVVSGVLLGAALSQQSAWANAPTTVVTSTIHVTTLIACGHAEPGTVSSTVVTLKTGVTNAMLMTKIKTGATVLLTIGLLAGATNIGVLSDRRATAQDDKKPTVEKTVEKPAAPAPAAKQEKEQAIATAWGQEVGGLQAGLSLRPGKQRAYHYGEKLTLIVRVRNVGKETVNLEYIKQFLDEELPTVTNADGKTVRQAGMSLTGFHFPQKVTLEPGEEVELETRMHGASGIPFELRPPNDKAQPPAKALPLPLIVGTGKVSIHYEQVIGDTSSGRLKDPASSLKQLSTGKLELEIKPFPAAASPATEK